MRLGPTLALSLPTNFEINHERLVRIVHCSSIKVSSDLSIVFSTLSTGTFAIFMSRMSEARRALVVIGV